MGPWAGLGRFREEKRSLILARIEPRFLGRSPRNLLYITTVLILRTDDIHLANDNRNIKVVFPEPLT